MSLPRDIKDAPYGRMKRSGEEQVLGTSKGVGWKRLPKKHQ